MAQPADLTRPPIQEALIDFRTALNENLQAATLKPLREVLLPRFPHVDEHRALEAKIEVKNGKPVTDSSDIGFHGLFFRSADRLDVAQFRRDGFTVNRLAPYSGWQRLKALATELLPLFLEHARPERVTRIATRFINRLTLPIAAGQPLREYLTAPPSPPEGVPSSLSSFLTRVTVHDLETQLSSNVTQALESTEAANPTVLLDIEVFREISPETELSNEYVGGLLESMRVLKNAIFFASITNGALDLYK